MRKLTATILTTAFLAGGLGGGAARSQVREGGEPR